ncbi:MAG TPA: CUB domain-containing protein, partial [Bacteroidia bacterium]|nr:CUB domain-containing protein [Bacteroidia bacterium]
MNKNLAYIFVLFLISFSVRSTNYNMGNATYTITCPGPHNFYDSGGPAGNYANNETYTITFYPSVAGQCISVSFTSFTTEACCDNLKAYDGPNAASPLLGTFAGTTLPPTITSTGGPITFVFTSDASINFPGWVATISCVACPPPPAYYLMSNTNVTLTCPPTYTLFYDSGGPAGNYSNSENLTKTFTAPAGYCLRFSFNSAFQTEACCDKLSIYDGPSGLSPLIGTYSNTSGPGIITSSGSSITFSFTSDASINYAGWEATVTCVSACVGMPSGGSGQSAGGGCLGTASVQLSSFGSTSACGITYQWQSGPSGTGPWSNVGGATSATLTVPTSTN